MFGSRQNRPYRLLENRLGYRFRQVALLEAALTHRSFRAENPDAAEDNQRLEFLGDAVLGLLAADYAYRRGNDEGEGAMTRLRSRMASGPALADTARSIGLGDWLRLGKGEARSGGGDRTSSLTDALEALVGAAFLDGGWPGATKLFRTVFGPRLSSIDDLSDLDNPKGKLQEISQMRYETQPVYRIVGLHGPDHQRHFVAEVILSEHLTARGEGPSKRLAEMQAAQTLLDLLADAQDAV